MAEVSVRSVTRASEGDRRTGLVAFLRIQYDGLVVDSVCLRRTRDSRYVLGFPEKRDRAGRLHDVVRPINYSVRREIETKVLGQLNVEQLDRPGEDADG